MMNKNVEDLVQMDEISEPMITHNLRKRFYNNQIYVRDTLLLRIIQLVTLHLDSTRDSFIHSLVRMIVYVDATPLGGVHDSCE